MHRGRPPAPGEAPPTATTMAAAARSVSLEEGEAAYAWLTVTDRFGNPRHTGGDHVRTAVPHAKPRSGRGGH